MPVLSGVGVSGKIARASLHAVPRQSTFVRALLGGEI